MRRYKNLFDKVIELDNLFLAWDEFKVGKRSRPDVELFELELEKHLFTLRGELQNQTYKHSGYTNFFINDPKRRHIHKATVRDRIVHHAVFTILNPIFENMFIDNSFSCRIGKGSHRGVEAVADMLRKESRNNSRPCYALKCDVKKFFDSIDHQILLAFLSERIRDTKMMNLLTELVESYENFASFGEREREREREYLCFAQKRNTNRQSDISAFRQHLYECV